MSISGLDYSIDKDTRENAKKNKENVVGVGARKKSTSSTNYKVFKYPTAKFQSEILSTPKSSGV